MATPTPQPGVTPSAGPSGGASSSDQAFNNALAAIAAAQGTGSSGTGKQPGTWDPTAMAVESGDYGPLSRPQSDYEHGTYRQIPQQQYGFKTVQDMTNEYYNWNQDQKDQFRSKVALIDKSALTASDADLLKVWASYVQQSADYLTAGQHLTPIDILSKDIATKGGAAGQTKQTTTSSDTTLTSRADSDAIFQTAAQSLLGRNPTDAEKAQFAAMLTQAEQANPTSATTTSTYDSTGNATDQTRTTQGGFNSTAAQDLARQVAQQSPDYGANAANNYMNVLLGLVGVK